MFLLKFMFWYNNNYYKNFYCEKQLRMLLIFRSKPLCFFP